MKIANNLRQLTIVFGGVFLITWQALALDNYKEFKRDHWDVELGTQYFYSNANYSSSGNEQKLTGENYYQLLDVKLETRYVPRRDWSVFAWGNVGNSESKDSLATRSNSSLSEVAAGFDFLMYSGWIQLVPEVVAIVPLEKVEPTSDTVLNSEGVMQVQSRLIAQKDFGVTHLYGWLGFNYRAEGRSFLMPWGVGAQFRHSRFRWGAELFGSQSVTEDTVANPALRTAYLNAANAGSFKFYAADPSVVDTQVYAGWMFTRKLNLSLQGGMTLAGTNAAAGFHAGGFIRYSFDLSEGYVEDTYVAPISSEVPSYRSNMYEESEVSSERKVKRFREALEDGIDQNLFKAPPKKKPRIDEDELQRQLDETEFDVELRSQKKRKR